MSEVKSIDQSVEELAALMFTPAEVSIKLEIPEHEITEHGMYYRSYMKGRLQAEVDLRTSIFKLAKSGSSPAQTMMLDLLKKSEAKKITEWQR